MSVTSELKRPFVEKILPAAQEIYSFTQIHPKILIAQAAHESRWGTSKLSTEANNLFGMKAGSWVSRAKPIYAIPTWEYTPTHAERIQYWEVPGDIMERKELPNGGTNLLVKCFFRKYESWKESCEDWADLIIRRYPLAYEGAKRGEFLIFARGLRGYATDPRYEEKICLYEHEPLLENLVA